MSKNEMQWVRQTEFGWGVGYTQLFCIKISGVYEKPLEFFTPGPQLACSPGTWRLKMQLIPQRLNWTKIKITQVTVEFQQNGSWWHDRNSMNPWNQFGCKQMIIHQDIWGETYTQTHRERHTEIRGQWPEQWCCAPGSAYQMAGMYPKCWCQSSYYGGPELHSSHFAAANLHTYILWMTLKFQAGIWWSLWSTCRENSQQTL